MGEDNQSFPLAHYQAQHKSDEELATMKTLKKERTNKCFIYVFSAFVFLSVAVLIFALIVLRVSTPNLAFSSITVHSLTYSSGSTNGSTNSSTNSTSSSPSFTLLFVAEITVDNSNFGPFNFENGTVGLSYTGVSIGDAYTGAGRARAKGTKRMNVTVGATSNNNGFLDPRNVSSDLNSGILKLRSYVQLRGRVRLIQIFRRRTTSEINCAINLNLNTRQFQDLACD